MDIVAFITELLKNLSAIERIKRVDSQSEGPTVRGRVHFDDDFFLAFYYNQVTGTQAFALVRSGERLWGIDYDNLRGWHEHPFGKPEQHAILEPQTIPSVIQRLKDALPHVMAAADE